MKEVFIRDDDVYKYDGVFLELFDFLKTHRIPLVYGVVPALVTDKIIRLFNKEKNKNPALFDIAQHGLTHKNYSKNLSRKYEFGPLRSYAQQKKDILTGHRLMLNLFGKNFTPAFIPPYHGYDRNTLKIIKEMKFTIFSAGRITNAAQKIFLDLPAQVALNDYTPASKPVPMDAKIMIARFLGYFAKNTDPYLGMVFHHNAITKEAQFIELKIFFLFLKRMERERLITIRVFSQFLSARKNAVI